jgi:hypothetical protein
MTKPAPFMWLTKTGITYSGEKSPDGLDKLGCIDLFTLSQLESYAAEVRREALVRVGERIDEIARAAQGTMTEDWDKGVLWACAKIERLRRALARKEEA